MFKDRFTILILFKYKWLKNVKNKISYLEKSKNSPLILFYIKFTTGYIYKYMNCICFFFNIKMSHKNWSFIYCTNFYFLYIIINFCLTFFILNFYLIFKKIIVYNWSWFIVCFDIIDNNWGFLSFENFNQVYQIFILFIFYIN